MTSISVVIVNYNAGDRLLRCLRDLEAQTVQPVEVLLVDNGSVDGSFETALDTFPDVIGIPMGNNLGFAAANNRAAERAKGEWLALLNPDAYPKRDWLEELLAGVKRWPRAKAFGSTQLDAAEPKRLDGAGDNFHVLGVPYRGFLGHPVATLPPEGAVFAPCAAAALYERKTFLRLGGFDERFFCYCEDVDFGSRLLHAGTYSVQIPKAVVLHEGSAIAGRQSQFTVYHGHRNRVWLEAKAAPPLFFWAMLPFHAVFNLAFVAKFWFTKTGPTYRRAIWDGTKGILQLRRERAADGLTSLQFMAWLVWSPIALMQRRGKVRQSVQDLPTARTENL